MNFFAQELNLPGVFSIRPKIFKDKRGYFLELFKKKDFDLLIRKNLKFVQENISISKKNVIRGIHYQIKKPQGKLLRVLDGKIFDVVVDLRKSSKFYGKWVGVNLDSKFYEQIWIPPGFGHAFLTKSKTAKISYYVTDYWYPKYERCIKWNDKDLNIKWPIDKKNKPIISKKDMEGVNFLNAEI